MAVPGECEGLKVVIQTKVQSVDVESRVLKSTVEIDIHNGKTLSQELQRIHFTHSVSGGLFLPCGVIKAVRCIESGVVPRRHAAAGTMLNEALNNGMTPALEMQPQEASSPEGQ